MKKYKIFCLLILLLTVAVFSVLVGCAGDNADIDMSKPSVGLKFEANSDGTYYVSGIGACTDEVIVIPETTASGKPITGIGEGAFANHPSIRAVGIPSSIRTIGDNAFYGCSELKRVQMNQGLRSIGKQSFAFCKQLDKINLPDSLKEIGDVAFGFCESLQNIYIPEGLEVLGDYTFNGCDKLKGYKYDGAYYIGNEGNKYLILLRAENENVEACQVNYTTKFIHSDAFANCERLKSITLPEGLLEIGSDSFVNCFSLTAVNIPQNVTRIGEYAFCYCNNLGSVTFAETFGWMLYDAGEGNFEARVHQEDLLDGYSAVQCLTEIYYEYEWARGRE
ncbi:MAG: leucine-rich repeat domain-containing protein [Ruminococcaceae bacterium]|nr:leucine-rich repeat domain-containing protein [Oscillospiraceae bacterium]